MPDLAAAADLQVMRAHGVGELATVIDLGAGQDGSGSAGTPFYGAYTCIRR